MLLRFASFSVLLLAGVLAINMPGFAEPIQRQDELIKKQLFALHGATDDHLKGLTLAYIYYLERYEESGPRRNYHLELWKFALETPPQEMPALRAKLSELEVGEKFLDAFDEAVAWAEPLVADPAKAYRLSKSFHKRGKSGAENREFYASLARELAEIGRDADVPEWWFDMALSQLDTSPEVAVGMLHVSAAEGYAPAIREIFDQYLNGKNIEKDPFRAYDWLLFAQHQNLDLSNLYSGEAEALINAEDVCCYRPWIDKSRLISPSQLLPPLPMAK